MFRDIGLPELLIVLVIILLLFGANKIPTIANSLGRSLREFKQGMSGPEKPSAPPSTTESANTPPNKTSDKPLTH